MSAYRSSAVDDRDADRLANGDRPRAANDNRFAIVSEPRVSPRESFPSSAGAGRSVIRCPSLALRAFVARNAPQERFVRCADRSSLHYAFDTLGNLKQRQDTIEGTTENFCYDGLNRLANYALGGTSCTTGTAGEVKSVSYDAIGNPPVSASPRRRTGALSKSDVGSYSCGTGAGPHAVTGVTGTVNGVVNPAYTYDADGNMTAGAGRTVSWTAFNMVAQITQGTATVAFAYDSEHTRITQTVGGASPSTTVYLNALGAQSEKFTAGTATTWRDYIQADGRIVAEKFSGSTAAVRYFVLDHLGSVAVITDENGAVTERLSYDAWGQRRCANGTGNASCFTTSATTRGFTNQEEIDGVGLVNLNARIYDPVLGRFMSADPTVEAPFIPQDLNRYSYTGNNPLSFTDTSGLCFLGCFWKSSIFKAVLAIAIVAVVPELLGNLEISFGLINGLNVSTFAAVNLGIAGGLAGFATTGSLKGAIVGAFTAGGFYGAGSALASGLSILGNSTLDTFIVHGLVGGISSVAGGGNFGSGFLAAGVGSLADLSSFNLHDFAANVAEHAVFGGVGSVLGGGKFENGAVTGAFGYLFNKCVHGGCLNDPRAAAQQLRQFALDQSAAVSEGKTTSLEALARIFDKGADIPYYQGNEDALVDDVAGILANIPPGGLAPPGSALFIGNRAFDDSGFGVYADGSNQVRHFVGGFNFGYKYPFLSRFVNTLRPDDLIDETLNRASTQIGRSLANGNTVSPSSVGSQIRKLGE